MYTESIKHTLICRNDKAHNGIKLPKIYVQLLTYWCKETYYIYPTEVYKFGTWKNFDIVPDTTNHLYLAQYPDTPQYAKLTRKFVKTSNGGYFNIKPAIHKIGGKFQKRTYTVKLTTIDENLCFLNSQLNHNAFNEKEIENYSLDDHYKLVDKIKSLNLAEITSTPKPDEHNSITYNELDHVPEPVSKSNLDVTQTIPITVKADTINSNIEEFDSFENTMTIEDNLITNSLFSSSNSNTHYINKDFQKLLLEITNAETNNYLPSLEDFLKKRKITIKRVNEERDYGDIRYILSKFLGNNYEQINIFLEKLKSSISRGGRFSMSLRGFSQKQVSNICQWANSLYQNAFLTEYRYRNAPQFYLTAEVSLDGEVQNFFTGDWLELYVILTIKNVIEEFIAKTESKLNYQIFSNVFIELENEDEFELDIILVINEKLFYWFECKSGQYQSHVQKYSNFAKKYDFPKERSFVILADVYPSIEKHLTYLNDINFCSIEQFKEQFNDSLYNEIVL